jgi:hypothetical protein
MFKFKIFFKNLPALDVEIQDSLTGKNYYNLLQKNYNTQMPVYRDIKKYTVEYMHELIKQAKTDLGWDWSEYSPNDYKVSTKFHKDIEVLLKEGFNNVAAENDNLLHEIHLCLHVLSNTGTDLIQIEWFNDDLIPIDDSFQFQRFLNFGDLSLQYPFVGSSPLQLYIEKDYTNISQTCKFHSAIKPGINIFTCSYTKFTNHQELLNDIKQHDYKFYNLHGPDKILRYTGYPVIGKIINLNTLMSIRSQTTLEFEKLEFN